MALLVYAAKFICGTMPELPPAEEGPVEAGSYATTINVHNPNPREAVPFAKKAVLLFEFNEVGKEGFEIPKAPYERSRRQEELGPDYGMQLDGRDIRELLTGLAAPPPAFIEGRFDDYPALDEGRRGSSQPGQQLPNVTAIQLHAVVGT